MTNLEHRLSILSEKVAAGDGEAQLDRMRLYAKAGETGAMSLTRITVDVTCERS
jgi:hypothetical protein